MKLGIAIEFSRLDDRIDLAKTVTECLQCESEREDEMTRVGQEERKLDCRGSWS